MASAYRVGINNRIECGDILWVVGYYIPFYTLLFIHWLDPHKCIPLVQIVLRYLLSYVSSLPFNIPNGGIWVKEIISTNHVGTKMLSMRGVQCMLIDMLLLLFSNFQEIKIIATVIGVNKSRKIPYYTYGQTLY